MPWELALFKSRYDGSERRCFGVPPAWTSLDISIRCEGPPELRLTVQVKTGDIPTRRG